MAGSMAGSSLLSLCDSRPGCRRQIPEFLCVHPSPCTGPQETPPQGDPYQANTWVALALAGHKIFTPSWAKLCLPTWQEIFIVLGASEIYVLMRLLVWSIKKILKRDPGKIRTCNLWEAVRLCFRRVLRNGWFFLLLIYRSLWGCLFILEPFWPTKKAFWELSTLRLTCTHTWARGGGKKFPVAHVCFHQSIHLVVFYP